jgi:pimeloyl-ACP methyl ester carboxylesterase
MATATVNGLSIAHEVIGEGDRPWVITPGGRFSKDDPGIREMAQALADRGGRVLIWDRPNCGASDVCFEGASESEMQADTMAALLEHLDMAPAVIIGGSGGSRISMLAAARHREVASALAVWWISGGPFGLMSLAVHYCGGSFEAAWTGGMEAVVELQEWAEVLERNPANRARFLAQDPAEFIETMGRWMAVYCPGEAEVVPGMSMEEARAFDLPTLVFRSGAYDIHHTRATSERIAEALPNTRMVEPPWGDREWAERQEERIAGTTDGLFVRWPLLVPQIQEWADDVLVR